MWNEKKIAFPSFSYSNELVKVTIIVQKYKSLRPFLLVDLSAFCFDLKKECLSYKSVKREEKQVNVRCNKNKDGSK